MKLQQNFQLLKTRNFLCCRFQNFHTQKTLRINELKRIKEIKEELKKHSL